MNKPKTARKINRNLFWSKMVLQGYTLTALGGLLDPPLSRFRVCQIINEAHPEHRLAEIARVLKTNVATVFPKITQEVDARAE